MKIQLTTDGSEDGGRRPGASKSGGLWKLRMVLSWQPATQHRPQSYNGKELYSANNTNELEMDSPLQAPERNAVCQHFDCNLVKPHWTSELQNFK